MRIGFHCWEFPPTIVGGLGTYAQCIVQALAERGHDLHVWAPEQPGWPQSVPPIVSPQVHERRIPLFDATPMFPYVISDELQSWGRFFSDLLTYNLMAAAETRQVEGLDVIAVQDWLSGMGGLVLAQERRAPVVFHVHSAEWGRQPGGGAPVVHHFEGALGYHAQGVITVSEAMREDLIAHGWAGDKIFAVWNGVDPQRYRPDAVSAERIKALRERYGIGRDEPVLLFVGRMTQVKGVQQLVEAMPAVLAEHSRAHLIILGVGELEGPVARRVRDLDLDDHVHLRCEFVNEAERIAHYQLCDVAVFPSTYEPFGIVCLEAMAMGKPVVAGARGVVGFREQVIPEGPGQTGFHVDANSTEDIAWGLNEALASPTRWSEWGGNGRQRVLDHFTWAHAAEKTEAVYREIMRRHPPS